MYSYINMRTRVMHWNIACSVWPNSGSWKKKFCSECLWRLEWLNICFFLKLVNVSVWCSCTAKHHGDVLISNATSELQFSKSLHVSSVDQTDPWLNSGPLASSCTAYVLPFLFLCLTLYSTCEKGWCANKYTVELHLYRKELSYCMPLSWTLNKSL